MKESTAISNLMEGFPSIWKQDPLDVQLYYIHKHLQATGGYTRANVWWCYASSKRQKIKKIALTEAEYLEEAFEEPPKKSKKAKVAEATGFALSTIQEEVQDLEPVKVLNKRTRSGKEAVPSPLQPSQPSIPKRKRKPVVKTLQISSEEEEDEDAVVQKALQLAREIEILAEVLARESTV